MDMSISLLSDRLLEIQHLSHSLLPRQPVTVHQVIFFLGKTTFCVSLPVVLCHSEWHVE